jgi:uridine kinase
MTRPEVIGRVADALVRIPVDHTLRVAVDGITAAGKTTFARELAAATRTRDRSTVVVSMDGFHQPRSVRYRQGRESATGYYEDAYDFDALRSELLSPLGPAGDGRFRTAVLDLATDQRVDAPPQSAEPGLIVIVDGSFLQRIDLIDAWDVTLFLRTGFDAARARGAARDAEQLGGLDNALRLFDVRYHAAQRRYLSDADPEGNADIVIDHDDPASPRIVRVG